MKFHFSKAERQHFSFFLLLEVYFNQRVNENTFVRARPVKINYCFGCVPEETLETTEKLSPFLRKIGRRFCT